MSPCVIEINDSEIRLANGAEIIVRSPGYAAIDDNKLHLGQAALRQAYLNPRKTYNKFWNKLNQDMLQLPTKQYRHNADLAYAHLLELYEQGGKPKELVFAVPGSYTNEQLSLLLGIAESCPFTAIGLVDSAVASTAAIADSGNYQYIEIYLHQIVITRLEVDSEVKRLESEIIDQVGLDIIFNKTAEFIADLFIQQSRFDPQHHAESEQFLYDHLPHWIQALKKNREIAIEIQYQDKIHQAKLQQNALIQVLQPIYQSIIQHISPSMLCLVTDRLAILPHLIDMLPAAEILKPETVFKGCQEHLAHICTSGPPLNFVTKLPITSKPAITATISGLDVNAQSKNNTKTATHVVHEHQAYALTSSPIYFANQGGAPSAVNEGNIVCSIVMDNNVPVLRPEGSHVVLVNKLLVNNVTHLSPGDVISFDNTDVIYTLINVAGNQ